jgi:hypothetical protein
MMTPMEERIGSVIKFFDKISVATMKLYFGDIAVGDTIRVKGTTTDITRKIALMESDHQSVQKAARGVHRHQAFPVGEAFRSCVQGYGIDTSICSSIS